MASSQTPDRTKASSGQTHHDAVVVGAGFSGLRALYELRKQGLQGQVFESGSGIGGTWFWNRYPGARTDSESWVYIFTFLNEIDMEWTWKERYPQQAEVEEYLNKLADHLKLRESIKLSTTVKAARRDEERNLWVVKTSDGAECTCDFLITGTGPLATPIDPPFPGLSSFKGEWFQTATWPAGKIDFAGKRVAVIGTGATGVQVIPIVAHSAKQLTVFQRTPNYVIPGRNAPLLPHQTEEINRDYKEIKERALKQHWGFDMIDSSQMHESIKDDPAEVQRVLEGGWEKGGFRYFFETFGDLLLSDESNRAIADFIRRKIKAIVRDPETAELLCPQYPVVSKRPPLGHHYYETFNRPHVRLVDIKKDPIQDMTPNGLRTQNEEFEFDMIIFALGFDAATGTLAKIDIRNKDDQKLGDELAKRLETNLGITVPGFPNLYMIFGPQAAFANSPMIIDITTDWIGRTIGYMKENNKDRCESTREGAQKWSDHVRAMYEMLIIAKSSKDVSSWMMGSNIADKEVTPVFYFGGVPAFNAAMQQEIADGYPGHTFTSTGTAIEAQ